MADTIGKALKDNLVAEISVIGESITFKGQTLKALVGTTNQTKAMRAAGYYENEAINMVLAQPGTVDNPEPPKVNEFVTYQAKQFRITEVETLEFNHGYNLTLEGQA